jgi:regulator of cell morphogenesis and NO signaling
MTIASDTTVGRLATKHAPATRVFERHGIDYCCGGDRPLAEVCREKGLDPGAVLEEIRAELEGADGPQVAWDEAPLGDLIEHILTAFHAPLAEELPRLEAMAHKVLEVHRDKDPERLGEVLSVYLALEAELQQHMMKEERILFPMVLHGQGAMAGGPITVMRHEHDEAAAALRRLRELTNGYEAPAEACNTWRALWAGLAALEESLHRHIHLENNVLFPRVLAG